MSLRKQSGHSNLSFGGEVKSDNKIEDDCFTDSGVVSGEILSVEQFDSNESIGESASGLTTEPSDNHDVMKLDSGVDIGLTDSFSGLSLRNDKKNNLSCEYQPVIAETPALNIEIEEDNSKRAELPPWQIYFQQDDEGDTQLHIAIIQGFKEAVWALLSMCPHPSLLDIRNDAAQTPLHLAVLTAQPLIVRRLILAGAKVNSRDCDGNTPLHLSSAAGDVECLRALVNPPTPHERHSAPLHLPSSLDQKNYNGETCVHLATMGGHLEVLKSLVWYGADINAREGKSGHTALHIAIEGNNAEIAGYLIGECRGLLPGMRNYAGRTARRLASSNMVELLPSTESDDDYDSEEDDNEYDSDDEMSLGEDPYFVNVNIRGPEAINVA